MSTIRGSPRFLKVPEAYRIFRQPKRPCNNMSRGQNFKPVMSGVYHYKLSRNYLRMVGYRPGLPYLKHQRPVTNSSYVVARVHVGDSASVTAQTCPELHCAPAMAVAIKSDNAKTQLPP